MRRTPTLENVQCIVRVQVCAGCPYRTPGRDSLASNVPRACEASCPLFLHLPVLKEAARQLDPMVGHRARVLSRIIRRTGRAHPGRSGAARRNGKRLVALLEGLFS